MTQASIQECNSMQNMGSICGNNFMSDYSSEELKSMRGYNPSYSATVKGRAFAHTETAVPGPGYGPPYDTGMYIDWAAQGKVTKVQR